MVQFTIFLGGYSSFILSYLFDSDTSAISQLQNITTGSNPSWLVLHPTNSSILYATNEDTVGAIQSFAILPDGQLSLLDTTPSNGNGPAFAAALSDGEVAAMNFGSGDGLITPTDSGGANFVVSNDTVTFPPPEGGASNPHMVLEFQPGMELFVTDLGADKIWRLSQDAPSTWTITGFMQHDIGSGPRHMAVRNDRLFVIHEKSSTLTVQAIPEDPIISTPLIANVSVVPENKPPNGSFFAAEIIIPNNPNATLVYGSNRNIVHRDPTVPPDPQGDSIAIFQHVNVGTPDEGLELLEQVFTGLEELRGVALGSGEAGQQYLVALGAQGGGMVIYELVEGGKNLTEVARDMTVPPRTSAVML